MGSRSPSQGCGTRGKTPNGEWLQTFAVIKTIANELTGEVHDRIPVKPDLSRARELGWSFQKADEFISTSKLCEDVVLRFLQLVKRRRTGRLQPIDC